MRVLLIEDDESHARMIKRTLERAQIGVSVVSRAMDGLDLAAIYPFDLILLDLNLPDLDGYDVLRRLRSARSRTPTIVLTGDSATDSLLRAFDCGATDYLTKPFRRAELVARVHAVIRRSMGHAHTTITTGIVSVDVADKIVRVDGQQVRLSKMEYQMIERLSLKKGAVLSRADLIDQIYGEADEPDERTLSTFILRLRRKLAVAAGGDACVVTIHGHGYTLRDPEDLPQDGSDTVAA